MDKYKLNIVLLILLLLFPLIAYSQSSIEDIVIEKQRVVLTIFSTDIEGNVNQGSGFFISSEGYVLATAHQIKGAQQIIGKNYTGKTVKLMPVYININKDIAVLKGNARPEDWVNMRNLCKVKPGMNVFTLASPENLAFSVITGSVSSINREYKGNKVYQLLLSADPGTSGAPVFDNKGLFVGMIIGKLENTSFTLALTNKEIEIYLRSLPIKELLYAESSLQSDLLIETEIVPEPGINGTIFSAINYYNKGVNSSELEKKVEYYKKATQLYPEFFEAWYNLGVIFSHLGRYEEAERALRRAIQLNSKSKEALRSLGQMFLKIERYEEAKEIFSTCITLCTNCPELYNDLGETLRRMNRLDEAEKCFKKSLEFNSDYSIAYYNLGLTKLAKDEKEEAIAFFQKYVELSNNEEDKEKVSVWIDQLKEVMKKR